MQNGTDGTISGDTGWPLELSDFVARLGVAPEEVLRAFYWLVRRDPTLDRFAIINAGCSDAEVASAEERVRHMFHPLHRLILTLSNGGTIPFIGLSLVAAAVPREREWHIVGPFLTPEERAARPPMNIRQIRPIQPMQLGTSLRKKVGDALADQFHLDELIPFAAGFGGEKYCYVRSHPHQIKAFQDYGGGGGVVDDEAEDFGEFIGQQLLDPRYRGDEFIALLGDALRAI